MQQFKFDRILFFDMETVSQKHQFKDLDEKTSELFTQKTTYLQNQDKKVEQLYQERAAIYAEFGKIICISVGFINETYGGKQIRIKSFYHQDEWTLLNQFKTLLEDHPKYQILCGHNSKEFDIPYVCRRMLIHGIPLPDILNISGKKPWEIQHLDTMEMWKFGDFKAFTSLALLCHIFDIPTPKDDISGSDVGRVYYEENNLDRIKTYCEKDVIALIQLFLKMKGFEIIDETNIHTS